MDELEDELALDDPSDRFSDLFDPLSEEETGAASDEGRVMLHDSSRKLLLFAVSASVLLQAPGFPMCCWTRCLLGD